jgi:glycine cleavage system regulatory protein
MLSDRARGSARTGRRAAWRPCQFAGIVHFEVPGENARALADALAGLESVGLRVVIAESDATTTRNRRLVRLELVGQKRPGLMRDLSADLAARGGSHDERNNEITRAPADEDRAM